MSKQNTVVKKEILLAVVLGTSVIGTAVSCIIWHNYYLTGLLTCSSLFLTYSLISHFSKRFNELKQLSEEVASGNAPNLKASGYKSEIASNMILVHNKIQEIIKFVQTIGNDTFEFKYIDPMENIGSLLIQLSENQKKYIEDERRRNWKNEGLARFGEILRMDDRDLKEMTFQILRHLVQYVDANQGGFYIENEDEEGNRFLELTSCYAYDKKKFEEKRIDLGKGILGQVMLEKDVVYLKDVPDDYVNITSGLGEATAKNVIVIPLVVNEKFYGAIELALFQVLEEYHIEFLKAVAENIASTIGSIKTNDHNKKMLEESERMTKELITQEEQMRQNVEELQAIQEDIRRNQVDRDELFSALNSYQNIAEIDFDGNVLTVNQSLITLFGYSENDLKANSYLLFPRNENAKKDLWKKLRNEQNESIEYKTSNNEKKDIWLNAHYATIKNSGGELSKVLMIAQDITTRKLREQEFEKLSLVADNTDNSVIITDASGGIEYVNRGFTDLTGYTFDEVQGKQPHEILEGSDTDKETSKRIKERSKQGAPVLEEILNYNKEGKAFWVSLAINPVKDENGKVFQYISVLTDITETKKIALDLKYKLEAISRSNAIAEYSTEGIIIDANDNFLEIFKYQKDELINKYHEVLVAPQEKSSTEYQQLWSTLAKGKFASGEFMRLDKDGFEVWLSEKYNPIFDIKGNPVKIMQFATDITRERNLQLKTERQQNEIKSHLGTINKTIASLEFDIEGKISYVNQVYLDVSGYSEKELSGTNYEFLLPEDEKNKPQTSMMWMSLKDGNFFTGQFRQKDKSGKSMWLTGTFNPILNDDGKPQKVMMFAQFITKEREKLEDLLQTVNAIKETVPFIELDGEGLFKNANEMFFKEFGYTRMELRKKPMEFFMDEGLSKAKISSFLKRIEKHAFIEEKVKLTTKSGAKKLYRATFTPIRNMENKVIRTVVLLISDASVLSLTHN